MKKTLPAIFLFLLFTAPPLSQAQYAIITKNDGSIMMPATVPCTPYRWEDARRSLLRAELDALFARAYVEARDELCHILEPADVYASDFPGDTFRVLKEKEQVKYGDYRTRRLVLEAWDRLPPAEA